MKRTREIRTRKYLSLALAACVVACSGSSALSGSGPDGGTSGEACTSFETCPSYACSCGGSIVNSRRCVDNTCLDRAQTCASTCGTELPKTDGGDPTIDSSVPQKDGAAPPAVAGAGDPCVPVSVSAVIPRVGTISALAAAHMVTPPTPANGSVNVSKTSAGKPSRITYDAAGSSLDYTDDFSYTSGGLLARFTHDAAGSSDDYTEDFSYTSAGLISRFTHDAAGSVNDLTEDFSYTSAGLCSRWTYDGAGSSDDSSLDISYSSSGAQASLTSNGPRATGAVVKACK